MSTREDAFKSLSSVTHQVSNNNLSKIVKVKLVAALSSSLTVRLRRSHPQPCKDVYNYVSVNPRRSLLYSLVFILKAEDKSPPRFWIE